MFEQLLGWLGAHVHGFQAASYIVTILGVPAFIFQYFRNSRREKIARRDGIYRIVDAAFVDFNKLIVNYPNLNVTWFDTAKREMSDEERVQQYIIFDLLTNMFERDFLAYQDASGEQRKVQWQGWVEYIDQYCAKAAYREWWNNPLHRSEGNQTLTYDKSFEEFISARFRRAGEIPEAQI
ncbi:MAG: hypothetical protein R3D68_07260 [Hyphomicrobiaceae bacterium]